MIPGYLIGHCATKDLCRQADCVGAAQQNPDTGNWFITMGHAGFNSPANNGQGYATEIKARAAIQYYLNRGQKVRVL